MIGEIRKTRDVSDGGIVLFLEAGVSSETGNGV